MASCLMSDAPYAPWLSDVLAMLEENKIDRICVAAPLPGGEVFTGYYHMDMMDKAVVATNIQADATLTASSVASAGMLVATTAVSIMSMWE